jgi:hypothetical protein
VLEGEAIIIDLETGVYFSLNNVGGRIWSLITSGLPASEIADVLAKEYISEDHQIQRDLNQLVDQLLAEGLIEPSPMSQAVGPIPPAPSGIPMPYEPPHLEIYRDMGDLLALDPPAPGLSEIPWTSGQQRDGGKEP